MCFQVVLAYKVIVLCKCSGKYIDIYFELKITCLEYVIYAFVAVNYRFIIYFLMKWVEPWTFHIRYQTLSSFSASGNAAQIIDFLFR